MTRPTKFRDRTEAGRRLAADLAHYADHDDLLVLGLSRGGVPVGFEVARELAAPLDVFVVRKLGVPGHEELAMGAIASGGIRWVDEALTRELGIADDVIALTAAEQQEELERRERHYRGSRGDPRIEGRTVVLVDDRLVSGSGMEAAVLAVRAGEPAHLVVAAPVGARPTCEAFRGMADDVVCSLTPDPFGSVSDWYQGFDAPTDDEVRDTLERAARELENGRDA